MEKKQKRSLKTLVGDNTYAVWIEMLRNLVPASRTHHTVPSFIKTSKDVSARCFCYGLLSRRAGIVPRRFREGNFQYSGERLLFGRVQFIEPQA